MFGTGSKDEEAAEAGNVNYETVDEGITSDTTEMEMASENEKSSTPIRKSFEEMQKDQDASDKKEEEKYKF